MLQLRLRMLTSGGHVSYHSIILPCDIDAEETSSR